MRYEMIPFAMAAVEVSMDLAEGFNAMERVD